MIASVELQIHRLFQELGQPQLVGLRLLESWRKNLLSEEEVRATAQFLLTAGLIPDLLGAIAHSCEIQGPIPWAQFAEALCSLKIKPSLSELEAFVSGVATTENVNELGKCDKISEWSSEFALMRRDHFESRQKWINERRQQLEEKLAFVRQERLLDSEAEIIQKMRLMFPQDAKLVIEEKSFRERWAKEIFRRGPVKSSREYYELSLKKALSPLEQQLISFLTNQGEAMAQKNPRAAQDLALMFYFMDLPESALKILHHLPRTVSSSGLELQCLMEARQFVTVLDMVSELAEMFPDETELLFASSYARVRALWSLGQKSQALSSLRNIVSLRPDYRDAVALLFEWQMGGIE